MKKSILGLGIIALLATFQGSNLWASASENLLEKFQYISKKSFSTTLNMGLYFQEATTLQITLVSDPTEKHDGHLPYFTSSFGEQEAILSDLFGAFMLQVTRGDQKHILNSILEEKAIQGILHVGTDGIATVDNNEIMSFVLKTDFRFERLYASGSEQGTLKIIFQNQPDMEPRPHWLAYPHPIFSAQNVGLQVLRTLLQKAQEEDEKKKVSDYFM